MPAPSRTVAAGDRELIHEIDMYAPDGGRTGWFPMRISQPAIVSTMPGAFAEHLPFLLLPKYPGLYTIKLGAGKWLG